MHRQDSFALKICCPFLEKTLDSVLQRTEFSLKLRALTVALHSFQTNVYVFRSVIEVVAIIPINNDRKPQGEQERGSEALQQDNLI